LPAKRIDAYPLTGQAYLSRFAPSRAIAEAISKRWMEGAVPVLLTVALGVFLLGATPVELSDAGAVMNEVAERGLVAVGLTIVLVAGGIDLSVGSIVGVIAIGSLVAMRAWGVPPIAVVLLAPVAGGLLGAINGLFIAGLKTRPFITTLVTLLTFRGAVKGLAGTYAVELAYPTRDLVWSFMGTGRVAGVPFSWVVLGVTLVLSHLLLTRGRWGWWIISVGSDRRSARRGGVPVNGVIFGTYVLSGVLASIAGLLTVARLGRSDALVGETWEIVVLTAVVLGGVSLRGGRGSVIRAVIGMVVVALLQQATIAMHLENGWMPVVLASALLVFALVDLKWGKYRDRIAEKLKLDPGKIRVGPLVNVRTPGSGWELNSDLTRAPAWGMRFIEGAEDCAIDDAGAVYCGDRRGWIWRMTSPDEGAVFARTGGLPLGHVWDLDGNLLVAVGGIGVQRIFPDGSTQTVANQVRRNWLSLNDDSAIRFADDLDLDASGAIWLSDFSTRTNAAEYMLELVEYRPNGRVIRIDREGSTEVVITNHVFPNGICTAHDGRSILIASTGLYRVDRLWVSGPRQGQLETVLEDLPGYPDNINRASDGNYWMSFVGMRTPMSDLMMKYPAARRRMSKELPMDDWIVPQLNVSCVVKFDEAGRILKVMWDETLANYPMVTSINEHGGYLYLCGINNNRVGRLELDASEIGTIDPRAIPGATNQAPPFGARTSASVAAS
jgi:ribose transport system permease protein